MNITDKEISDGWLAHHHYRYPCPVCGLDWMWTEPLEDLSASFDICPQCGNEFGYTDSGTTDEALKEEWEQEGRRWHSGVIGREQVERLMKEAEAGTLVSNVEREGG